MHTMDKETAITEARQRFKAWRCRPDSCSVPPLNPQRTNFDFEPIVSPHRFAIPFSGGHCIQLYKKLARCLIESATPVIGDCPDNQSEGMLHLWGKYIRTCRKRNARSSRSRSATARASGRWPVCWDAARPASAGRSNATRGFPSNESESYRPYRPKRLKTGPWTGRYYIAGPAQRKADRRRAKPRKPYRLSCGRLWARVAEWPGRGWSPLPVSGIIRRCLPKRTIIEPGMARGLQEIVDETDNRPMRMLGHLTPAEAFADELLNLQDKQGCRTSK